MKVKERRAAASANTAAMNGSVTVDTNFRKVAGGAQKLDKKLDLVRERVQNAISLSMEKVVAHYEDPNTYPLPAAKDSVERSFYDLMKALSASKRRKVIEKINETLKSSPAKRASLYKDIANVNFRSSVPIAEQVRSIPAPDDLRFTSTETNELLNQAKQYFETPTKPAALPTAKQKNLPGAPRGVKVASKLAFVIDSITCVETDDPRKDEISIGGFAFDTNGGNLTLDPFFVGKFKKGETLTPGEKGRLFVHDIDPNASEQTFFAGIFFIENDLIKNQETVLKLQKFLLAVTLAALVIASGLYIAGLITGSSALITAFIVGQGLAFVLYPITRITGFLGPDISATVQDELFLDVKLEPGDAFARTLTLNDSATALPRYKGDYRVNARWVGEL